MSRLHIIVFAMSCLCALAGVHGASSDKHQCVDESREKLEELEVPEIMDFLTELVHRKYPEAKSIAQLYYDEESSFDLNDPEAQFEQKDVEAIIEACRTYGANVFFAIDEITCPPEQVANIKTSLIEGTLADPVFVKHTENGWACMLVQRAASFADDMFEWEEADIES